MPLLLKKEILRLEVSYIVLSTRFPEMATFEEGFLYPLYLLLIGASVSGLAVALFIHWLESRRKKREMNEEAGEIEVQNRRKS